MDALLKVDITDNDCSSFTIKCMLENCVRFSYTTFFFLIGKFSYTTCNVDLAVIRESLRIFLLDSIYRHFV